MKNKIIKTILVVTIISTLIFSSCSKDSINSGESSLPVDNDVTEQNGNSINNNKDKPANGDKETGDNDINNNANEISIGEKRTINTLVVLETAKKFMDSEYIVQTFLDKAAVNELKFFSADEAMKNYKTKTIDNIEGVQLVDLIDKEKLVDAQSYIITSYDNSSIGVSKSDMINGILYIDDSGNYSVKFSGLSDKANIKKVVSIAIEQND